MSEWNVTPKEAATIQERLRHQVLLTPYFDQPRLVGGCDVSMNLFATEGYAGFVTLSYANLSLEAHSVVKGPIPFPYIPGLLSFREIPMLLAAWEQLAVKPEVLVVDGVGIAHPRRLGIASHLGLVLDVPTIGVSKNVLVGEYDEPANEVGAASPLHDKNEVIGAALRTKQNVKPVFVSPGHRIQLEDAMRIVRACIRKHRIPEPTRLAHNVVNEYRRRG